MSDDDEVTGTEIFCPKVGSPVRAGRYRRFIVVGAILVLSGLGGCGVASHGTGSAGSTTAGGHVPAMVRVTVVGDSITAGGRPLGSSPTPGDASWLLSLGGPPLEFTGGWAVPGATTRDMRAGVTAHPADVLVLMAGTNDVNRFEWTATAANIRAIVTTVGASRTLVSAIPPNDRWPTETMAFNGRLRQLAEQSGWHFFDPWPDVSVAGKYAPGSSPDGVHPTARTARIVGARIRSELLTYR